MWVVQSCSAERADLMSYFDTEQTPTTPTSSFSWIEDAAASSWSTVSPSNIHSEVISAQRRLTRRVRFGFMRFLELPHHCRVRLERHLLCLRDREPVP